jgi:carbon-monoxide dehydrogenase small subunit
MTRRAARMIELAVNGETIAASVPDRKLLCDFLREDLSLTGTHVGCEHGICGACTVLVDGRAVRSCLMLAVQADGRTITTIEGVSGPDGSLHPVQRAFHEQHALQCGFCTAGFIMSTLAYLEERGPAAGPMEEDEVREQLAGTLCRCTGYTNIVRAVCAAAADLSGSKAERSTL